MLMDSHISQAPESLNGFKFDGRSALPNFEQSSGLFNGYRDDNIDLNIMDIPYIPLSPDPAVVVPSFSVMTEAGSPDDQDSDPVLKYLNQILLEESIDDKPSMFYDPLALQAAEQSLYEVLGEKYPSTSAQNGLYLNHNVESPESFFSSASEHSTTTSSTAGSNSSDPQWTVDQGGYALSPGQVQQVDFPLQLQVHPNTPRSSGSDNSFTNVTIGQVDALTNANLIANIFSDSASIQLFKKGMEEASKFLPTGNPLVIDLDKYQLPPKSDEVAPEPVVKVEKEERYSLPHDSRGRKHLYEDDSDIAERNTKQSAVYVEEVELSEMFDKVLLCTDAKGEPSCCHVDSELPSEVLAPNASDGGKARPKKQVTRDESVDLRTLLISCAQSVATEDRRTASEQLKQIRQHASPTGDAYQRLACIFANGLEARMAGTGTQLYAALAPKKISAAEKLKAYQVYLSSCPFKKISIFFANKMIMNAASEATSLHIVDFGILYGFQWPILIQHLSQRPGGPPNLRITGIELPQPGFRPAERVEETGRRLARYCERFNVPFEYQAIATQNWETIKIEELNIRKGEVLAVNCLFRFRNLLDETVMSESPRDAVLDLIRKMNPDIFVNSTINGSYSAPFFLTRFREALFHYSALFDIFDATLPRDNEQRLNFEQAFFGREAMNVIACEGMERVERPETYKQWQVRHMRAGFKMLPFDKELVNKLRAKTKAKYHKDFVFDEDGYWMLQGWKGRIICSSCCWIPA